jgi:protein AATF/BFR2
LPQDFDPEDDSAFRSGSDDSASDDDHAPAAATEHYEAVGKSKLRTPQAVALGPKYTGTKVRRDALEDSGDEHDPFAEGFEDSEEEDVSSGEQDPILGNGGGDSSEGSEEEGDRDTDLTDEDEDMDDEDAFAGPRRAHPSDIDRAEIQKLMANKTMASDLSKKAKEEAEKGIAVKKQRTTFDTLLNSRIKLQKALVATNSLLVAEDDTDKEDSEDVVAAAEAAALQLWNNLNALRTDLHNKRSDTKRTHTNFTSDNMLDEFWEESKSYEASQKRQRTATLDHWATRTRTTTSLPQQRGRLQQPVKEQTLSDVLSGQLMDMDRLVAKTVVPRSCAPVQAAIAPKKPTATNGTDDAAKKTKKVDIYDDADFYTTLLSNLISQRSADTAVNFGNLSLQPWQAAREAKTKKVVDTKASKGRKLRYTVHDKLVSFMAPEDRGSWGETRVDDLFSGLLGRRVGLTENGGDGDEGSEEDAEVEGLRLFGGR